MSTRFFMLPQSLLLGLWCLTGLALGQTHPETLRLNQAGYLEKTGLNVMAFDDFYPEGHQGGVTIVLNGVRVAANGDVRLEPAPGQWQPLPKLDGRVIDANQQTITASLSYPDPKRDRRGFNPIEYPDLNLAYQVQVRPEADGFRIVVDLKEPLPSDWVGKVGFNLELFPGEYFGRSFMMDDQIGTFPRQFNGPMAYDADHIAQGQPLAGGHRLSVAPDSLQRHLSIESSTQPLQLLDGRAQHNNGWFIVRSTLPGHVTRNALTWTVRCHALPDWTYTPVIQISQVGYHPGQPKIAVIELDKTATRFLPVTLHRIKANGDRVSVKTGPAQDWGNFLRYHYLRFDFSDIKDPGVYVLTYGKQNSNIFQIRSDLFARHVWQPTLEYFLPVQMCHMRVNDRYRVWHGLCHMDDALMAPVNLNHFDGYTQGPSTLTPFAPQAPVPGLNTGGWHDAGDYDLRIESQISTVRILSQAWEAFHPDYDVTTVDQLHHQVHMHRPDQVPDILQQIEHGVLTVLGGYRNLGRLYRGIICPTVIPQYVLLGDGSTMTDNRVYDPNLGLHEIQGERSGTPDDRWVFTEDNPRRTLQVSAGLAAAARALQDYRPGLAAECTRVAEALYEGQADPGRGAAIDPLIELLLTTGKPVYQQALLTQRREILGSLDRHAWALGRVMPRLEDAQFDREVRDGLKRLREKTEQQGRETPYGVPYQPNIWGAGWGIQSFGVPQYFLHRAWPDIFDTTYLLNALNFVLGCHPGENTASFVSGVGAKSLTMAYGTNRAEFSHIPGGVGSGTALIRPDLPELKEWPFFWQQTEYVMGGGGSNFLFLALAADQVLKEQ